MRVAFACACVVASLAAVRVASTGQAAPPAGTARPRILGIAHVGLYVHDIEQSRVFYQGLLGYVEAYPRKDESGRLSLTFFKVNERQFLELFPEREARSDRLAHVALQTDDAEAMRRYLKSKGVAVPEQARKGRTGNINFTVEDPDGHTIEFVQYAADAPMTPGQDAFLGADRISPRLRHAGILVGSLQPAIAFYRDVLGFRETWRGSRDGKELNWVNLQLPDSDDYVEFMLYRDLPDAARRGSEHHISLEVSDVALASKTLQSRATRAPYARAMEIRTGINRKRHLNLYDPDGTRCELMEANTVDGKPAPSSPAPPPRVPAAPALSPAGWKLVWNDEFDGTSLGPTWSAAAGGNGWGNNEKQFYRPENARVEGGFLVIEARREQYQSRAYTSARLKTQGRASWRYGRIEARIRVPRGQGIWPAFWCLGEDIPSVGWPASGEIDIFEVIGREPRRVYGTVHGPGYSGAGGVSSFFSLPFGEVGDAFHLFAIEWDTAAIRWYFDNVLFKTVTPADLPGRWVFDHPFFIVLNVAVGGNWPGDPDDTTVFPQRMDVDYVRVYQRP